MRSLRLLVLAASLAASITAVPAYAAGGPSGGSAGAAHPVAAFKPFRMSGALFSPAAHALSGAIQYTLLPSGQVRLVVAYFNSARLPAGTALDVLADGVKIGTLATSAQGGSVALTTGLPRLTLQSRISLAVAGKPIASGAFTLKI